jgi:hypothetical protein
MPRRIDVRAREHSVDRQLRHHARIIAGSSRGPTGPASPVQARRHSSH